MRSIGSVSRVERSTTTKPPPAATAVATAATMAVGLDCSLALVACIPRENRGRSIFKSQRSPFPTRARPACGPAAPKAY